MINIIFKIFILRVIRFYQLVISPWYQPSCRFYPTCSNYCYEVIKRFGIKGVFIALKRIIRCNPFGGYGVDLVPNKLKRERNENE